MPEEELTEEQIREQLSAKEASKIRTEENLAVDTLAPKVEEQPATKDAAVNKLIAEVDRLKAQIEVGKQMRTVTEEKFQHLSEEIGELRSMLTEKDKQIGEFEAKTAKVYDMVDAVQPDKLMKAVQTLEASLAKTDAEGKSTRELTTNVTDELRDIREAISVFKNTEHLVKLNTDIGKQLANIEKVQGKIERQSNKVEDIFVELGKKTAKYDVLFSKVESLEKAFQDLLKGFDDVEVGYKSLVKQKDLDMFKVDMQKLVDDEKKNFLSIKQDIDTRIESIDEYLSKLDEAEQTIDKDSYLLLDEARKIMTQIKSRQMSHDKILSVVREVKSFQEGKKLLEDIRNKGTELETKLNTLLNDKDLKKIERMAKQAANLKQEIERFAKLEATLLERESVMKQLLSESKRVGGLLSGHKAEIMAMVKPLTSEIEKRQKEMAKSLGQMKKEREVQKEAIHRIILSETEKALQALQTASEQQKGEQAMLTQQTREIISNLITAEKALKQDRDSFSQEMSQNTERHQHFEKGFENMSHMMNTMVAETPASGGLNECEICSSENVPQLWICCKCGKRVCEKCARTFQDKVYCIRCLREAAKLASKKASS